MNRALMGRLPKDVVLPLLRELMSVRLFLPDQKCRSVRWSSSGSERSQLASFLATRAHFSSNWISRARGGKPDQLVVEALAMRAGQPAVSRHGPPIHLAEPAGLADAAPLGDMLQDRVGYPGGEPRIEQGRALALGGSGLAGAASEQASGLVGPVSVGDGEVSGVPLAVFGAVGIQAAEARQVVHGASPPLL